MKNMHQAPRRNYHVIATDPEAAWRIRHVEVRETSRETAKVAARQELALEKADHWNITHVVEAA